VARGDGSRGGGELFDTHALTAVVHLERETDEHHLASGPPDTIFALNWLHGTVACYDLDAGRLLWRTPPQDWEPWDGVLVPGGR
jgi:hypothetical protein